MTFAQFKTANSEVTTCAYNTCHAKYVSLFSRQGQKGTVAAARYRKAKNNAQIELA